MPLRILTGFVNVGHAPGPKSGQVVIGFNPHQLISSDDPTVKVIERGEVGPPGRFSKVPAKLVALRQITIAVASDNMRFALGDTIDQDQLTITWNGRGAAFTEEISYLVFGEVPDIIPLPPRDPGLTPVLPPRVPPPRRRRPKKNRKRGAK